ncbi:MAG: universal stress protein [Saccharospirillum sp.]|nr:universal stress protein [Saccharospirillum sp.]
MTQILACIDGSILSTAVCDAGAWASNRLNAPLLLLHALEKTESPEGNFSGNIGLGSREALLEELTALDEQRSKVALEHGKQMLEQAEARAKEDGAVDIKRMQRHGNLVETLIELEESTRLYVMGRSGETHENIAHSIGSHLESIVRAVHRPILIALPEFSAPESFMVAYDGSESVENALGRIADSPLLQGLPCHLVMVGDASAERKQQMQSAAERLDTAGYEVTQSFLEGDVQSSLQGYQQRNQIDLMVMGAYGHSRIRQFFVGSTTRKMIGQSDIPLLVLR